MRRRVENAFTLSQEGHQAALGSRLHGQGVCDSALRRAEWRLSRYYHCRRSPRLQSQCLRRHCLHPSLHRRQRRRFHRHPSPVVAVRWRAVGGVERRDESKLTGFMEAAPRQPRAAGVVSVAGRRASSAVPCLRRFATPWCIVTFPGRPDGRPSSGSRRRICRPCHTRMRISAAANGDGLQYHHDSGHTCLPGCLAWHCPSLRHRSAGRLKPSALVERAQKGRCQDRSELL